MVVEEMVMVEKIGGDSIFIFGSRAKSWRETVMTSCVLVVYEAAE